MQHEINLEEVSKEDLASWLHLEITRRYFAGIEELLKTLTIEIGAGALISSDNANITAQQYAGAVGFCNGLKSCLRAVTEKEDDES